MFPHFNSDTRRTGFIHVLTHVIANLNRYNRVRRAQAMGETTRDKWHSASDVKVNAKTKPGEDQVDAKSLRDASFTCPQAAAGAELESQASSAGSRRASTSPDCLETSASSADTSSPRQLVSVQHSTTDHPRPDADSEPTKVELPFPEWLLNFDAEKHACAVYHEIARGIMERGYSRPVVNETGA